MNQNGMYDYSETTPERETNSASKKIRVVLSSKQKLVTLLIGLLFGIGAIIIAVAMQYFWDFSFKYYVYAIPVVGITYLIKRDANITIFVFLGYVLGSYVLTYILGFLFIGYILFS